MTGLKTETVIAAQSAEDAKEAAESAQTAAEAARDAAQAVAGDFQGLSATASGLAAGTSPTVNVTHDEGGLFNLAFGIPKGDKGDQGDPPTDSQVQTAANNYLSQVITNPDSPPLDRALSSNAAAAPADMVGDLKSALKNLAVPVRNIDNVNKEDIKSIFLFAGQKITVTNLSSESYPVNIYINPYAGGDVITTFNSAGTLTFTAPKDGYLQTNKVSAYNIQMFEDFASPQSVDEKMHTAQEYADYKVEDLQQDIDNIANVRYNYFNVESVIRGKFISGTVGRAYRINDNSSYYCYVMPVDKNKKYVIERTDFVLYEIDENDIVLTELFPNTETHYREYEVQNQNTTAICFSWTGANPSSFMVLDYGVSFDTYIPYPFMVIPTDEFINGLKTASNVGKTYYVGGQSADYQSFSQCLKALKNDANPKTIYVNSGEYDIFEEMGGRAYVESIDASQASFVDVCDIVPPNTKIIGLGEVTLKYTPSDADIIDAAHAFLFSPLNIIGSCYVENITVIGSNCRYAIHIENGSSRPEGHDAIVEFKNVRAKRLTGNIGGSRQCVGCGIGIHAKWSFDNCLFESDADSIFTVHTNSPSVSSSDMITFNNCVIKLLNDEITNYVLCVFINGYLDSVNKTHHNYVFINNCYVRGKIKTQKWSGSETNVQSWDVQVINTWNTGIVENTNNNAYPIKVYGYTGQ